jgi:anti-sigma regulatory factor (Ser/Thr protein kinase)
MTAGTALRASLTIAGEPAQVEAARRLVIQTMGASHPCADTAVLLSSEVVTNSVNHSDSGQPGGTITITVTGIACGFRVEVLDAGGDSLPHVEATADGIAEGGRGLYLVSELSTRWGFQHEGTGVMTWFEVSAGPEPAPGSHPSGAAPKQADGTVTRQRTLTSCEGARS